MIIYLFVVKYELKAELRSIKYGAHRTQIFLYIIW